MPDLWLSADVPVSRSSGTLATSIVILLQAVNAHLSRTTGDAAPSPLSLGVYVDNLAQKAANTRRSLQEGQIRLVRGVFRVN
jgi:hypothetical protein